MIKILDRYIVSQMITPGLFGLLIFGSLWIANLMMRMVNLFVSKGVELQVVLKIFLYSLPAVIVTTIPMAALLASLLALGRLSGDLEITAMQACGIRFTRIVVPVAFVGVVATVVSFLLNEIVVPQANEWRRELLINEVVLKKPLPKIAREIFFKGSDEFSMFVRRYDPEKQLIQGVTMFQFRRMRFPLVTEAATASLSPDLWVFEKGRITTSDERGALDSEVFFERWEFPIERRGGSEVKKKKRWKEMSMAELWREIRRKRARGEPALYERMEFWFKSAFPFAPLVLVLLGAPLAVGNVRSGASIGVGLSILIMFCYYVLIAVGRALGQSGHLHPFVAAWTPNIVAAGVAAVLLCRKSN